MTRKIAYTLLIIACLFVLLTIALPPGLNKVEAQQPYYASRVVPYTTTTLPAVCNPANGQIAFVSDLNSGLYACGPLNTWYRIGTTSAAAGTQLLLGSGTVTVPGLGFDLETGLGLYRTAGGLMAITEAGVDLLTFSTGGRIAFTGVLQGALGAPANGQVVYCSDCTVANPCVGGGTGAIAKRLNGVWVCN